MNIITLSKVLPLFVYPLNVAIGLSLVALILLLLRKTVIAGLMLVMVVSILCVAGNPQIAGTLVANIERTYTPLSPENTSSADAIVMLAGALGLPTTPRVSADLQSGADRVLHTARLYRSAKAPLVIVSGGNIFPQPDTKPESFYISQLLQEWGVPKQAIITEGHSRNTYQNAVETKQIIDKLKIKRILLVTSALHMPRALAVFRSLGIDATPAVTDILVTYPAQRDTHPPALDWLPNVDALSMTTVAIREYLGMWAYRWLGWINDRADKSSRHNH